VNRALAVRVGKLFPFGNRMKMTTCQTGSQTMNEEPNQIQPLRGDASEPPENQLTVNEAAQALGVDSFTVFSLIQRDKVIPSRSSAGEITLPVSELAKLTEKGR